jgi:hypothetical protein
MMFGSVEEAIPLGGVQTYQPQVEQQHSATDENDPIEDNNDNPGREGT